MRVHFQKPKLLRNSLVHKLKTGHHLRLMKPCTSLIIKRKFSFPSVDHSMTEGSSGPHFHLPRIRVNRPEKKKPVKKMMFQKQEEKDHLEELAKNQSQIIYKLSPKRKMEDGEEVFIKLSPASKEHKLKFHKHIYSCSCPEWKWQRIAQRSRTCQHLKEYLGPDFERERITRNARYTFIRDDESLLSAARQRRRLWTVDGRAWYFTLEYWKEHFAIDPNKEEKFVRNSNGSFELVKFHPFSMQFDPTGWVWSPKQSGLRAVWAFPEKKIFLENGKEIIPYQGFVEEFPNFSLEGYLTHGNLNSVSWGSLLRQNGNVLPEEARSSVSFQILDAPLSASLETRLAYLKDYVSSITMTSPFIKMVPFSRCLSFKDLRSGVILREPGTEYDPKTQCPIIHKVTDHNPSESAPVDDLQSDPQITSGKCPVDHKSIKNSKPEKEEEEVKGVFSDEEEFEGLTFEEAELKKVEKVMHMITNFYQKGSEMKYGRVEMINEQIEKLLEDKTMAEKQLKALIENPKFKIHPKAKTYIKSLEEEISLLEEKKNKYDIEKKTAQDLFEWSKTIVEVCKWLETNLEEFKKNFINKTEISLPTLAPELAQTYAKGLDEIIYNLHESQDFFSASVDGRLRKYHELECEIISSQLEVLNAFDPESPRRQFIETELMKDLEYTRFHMKEDPSSMRRREKMLENHKAFYNVLKFHKEKLGLLNVNFEERIYDPKYDHYN